MTQVGVLNGTDADGRSQLPLLFLRHLAVGSLNDLQRAALRLVQLHDDLPLPKQPPEVRAPLSVEGVLAQAPEALKGVGLSARKVDYLRDLARHFAEGQVHVAQWKAMDDEAIIDELVDIRGIGRWTAEMFLIFHLMRPNVLPLDDLGLIKGISVNYFSGEPVSRAEARDIAEAWAPYRTVGTWYLWRSLDPLPVEY